MNARAFSFWTDGGTSIDVLGRFDPPSPHMKFKTCDAHGRYSVEVEECPRCRLARTQSEANAEIVRIMSGERRCGCGCGEVITGGLNGQRKYLNPTHAKRQFARGLRSAEKRLRAMGVR